MITLSVLNCSSMKGIEIQQELSNKQRTYILPSMGLCNTDGVT